MQIREYRIAARLTQRQLAELSGVNIRQIQKIESGEISIENITLKNAVSIARALNVHVDSLLE